MITSKTVVVAFAVAAFIQGMINLAGSLPVVETVLEAGE